MGKIFTDELSIEGNPRAVSRDAGWPTKNISFQGEKGF